ncbi:MAG: lipopolysaccharide export system permease protein, partial [Myxococcota bacterium]
RLIIPMMLAGAIFAGITYYFNDQVLPEANHRLKNLMIDIGNKTPTLTLREGIVNVIETGDLETRYFLQATQIDPVTSELTDVTIYDLSDPARTRTIYADSGAMAFDKTQTDLFLTLHDGTVFETTAQRRGSLQRTHFTTQVIPIRGVGDILERSEADVRSDREMSIVQLKERADEELMGQEQARSESLRQSLLAVRTALLEPEEGDTVIAATPNASLGLATRVIEQPDGTLDIPDDGFTRGVIMTVRTSAMRADVNESWARRYWVEIHKKLAISFACIVFVMIGLPTAVRFPRGGVGMVISVSVGMFGIYWMGLIGGENIADKGLVSPFLAMWAPNLVFFTLGLYLLRNFSRSVGETRGGGSWSEAWGRLGAILARPFRSTRTERAPA